MVEYVGHERLSMQAHPTVTEKWVQARIEDDPSLLGLGEVDLKDSERRQSAGGRLDLLLHNPETQTRYEVELMLGPTDESHIIRTIEYWDHERRRYPQYEHVAVIVAEEITARFFNVISLLNGQIPLVAIQMSLIKVGEAHTLVFTKVLDHVVLATDADDTPAPPSDRAYWLNKASGPSVELAEALLELAKGVSPGVQANYTKQYIGLAVDGVARNFAIASPRKKGYIIAELKLPNDEALLDDIAAEGFEVMTYDAQFGILRIRLREEDLQVRHDQLVELLQDAAAHYDGQPLPSRADMADPADS